jgi:arsenate reductase-like glutaredoxin family protein
MNWKPGRDKMNIQIFGKKKCFDSQKTERYFKERKIKYQYVDILRYGLSKGEFESVKTAVGLKEMINVNAKEYTQLNMQYFRTSGSLAEETLFNNPVLYKTPIVRNGRKATVGYQPEVWKTWE